MPTKERPDVVVVNASRLALIAAVIVFAPGVGGLLTRLRSDVAVQGAASPTASPTLVSPSASPSPTLTPASATLPFCGAVTGYAADGAHMLVTLTSGSTSQQFNFQYRFAKVPTPIDIGDRFVRGEHQLLRVEGRPVEPDSGSPNGLTLRDFTLSRVDSCP